MIQAPILRNAALAAAWVGCMLTGGGALGQPLPNPDLVQKCPYDIIFVLDESGSIVGSSSTTVDISGQLRDGARNLMSALNGTGSRVAVVEFSTNARRAIVGGQTGYQTIDNAYVAAFDSYIGPDANTTGNALNYDPEDLGGWTNWEAA